METKRYKVLSNVAAKEPSGEIVRPRDKEQMKRDDERSARNQISVAVWRSRKVFGV